jgi:phenylalanyl-tRNA synthetase beta chain
MGLADTVLELGITPNRPDCLSMIGVAREVAAGTGVDSKPPAFDISEQGSEISSLTSVTIDDDDGCPRYAARIIEDVIVGTSPSWMQDKLIKAGLRPLNNIVDITNYVLIELGHPLHAFDYDKLEENRIIVRRAKKGESITTLDGLERKLEPEMLVIADAELPVAIAGVMGGAGSEVTELTKTVLLESAYFNPISIRRTSKSLGLSTEASYRFERGTDPEMAIVALDRAASLMAELAGGKVATGRIDEYPKKIVPPEIELRHARVRKILGIDVPAEKNAAILSSLGFEILSEQEGSLHVRVPTYRPDISAEIDLIEEIARMHGYDKIESTYPQDSTVMTRGMQADSLEDVSRSILTAAGFSEVITYSFGAPADMADLSGGEDGGLPEPVKMKNPLSEDASVLRTTIIPGILQSLRTNINAGTKDLKLFETGKVYFPAEGEVLPEEKTLACAAITGLPRPVDWKTKPDGVDFFDLKGIAESLVHALCSSEMRVVKTSREGFHPGICADIFVGDKAVGAIGKIGEVHPRLLDKYEIEQKVYLFEIDLDAIAAAGASPTGTGCKYKQFSRFPSAERDLAVVVDESVEAAAVSAAISKAGGNILDGVLLFDVYRGKQIGEGKKSLAFGLRFQSADKTLTDDKITASSDRILRALEAQFSAKLRA